LNFAEENISRTSKHIDKVQEVDTTSTIKVIIEWLSLRKEIYELRTGLEEGE
jgi:hypothetical protein